MDQVLQLIRDRQPADVLRRQRAARSGVPALEVLAERLAGGAGVTLSEGARQFGGAVLQWTTGIGAGVLSAALRERLPGTGLRRGLGYGAAFPLMVDDGLVTLLGLAPPPWAFPSHTHARGIAGDLVFGAVAELMLGAPCAPAAQHVEHRLRDQGLGDVGARPRDAGGGRSGARITDRESDGSGGYVRRASDA